MGGFAEQLGSEQGKIGAVEAGARTEKEKAAELAATLERNHATFFGEVDSAKNALNTAESSLTDTNDLQTVGGLKDELKKYLVSVAATGNEALRNAQQGKPAEQAKLSRIDALAGEVNTKSAELKNTVPFFIALEKGDGIYKTKAKPEVEKIEGIKNDEKLTPAQKREQILKAADAAIDALGEAKQAMPANAPEDLAVLLQETLKPIHEGLEEAGKIKFFYAVMDLSASDEYKKYIVVDAENGGTIKFTDAYKALAPDQQQEVQMAISGLRMKIESELEAKTCANEHEKSFYSGKQKMLAGDKPGAKTDLLVFYNAESKNPEHSPENTTRLAECKELLKQIALFEVAEAEGRLNTIAADIEAQWANVTTGRPPVGFDKNLAYVYIANMRKVIEMARERINTGEALTVANVYKDLQAEADKLSEGPLRSWRMGFQSEGKHNLILDVLRTQQEIDNNSSTPEQRKAKLIEKAKEARELGLFSLAKQYYEKAFQPEIDSKRNEINREDFIQKMRSDAEIQEKIKASVESWEKDFKPKFIEEYKAQHEGAVPTDAEVTEAYGKNKSSLQEQLFNQMANEAYGKALRTLVHRDMMAEVKNAAPGAASSSAKEWDSAYGATFVNVENFDVAWGEFWKFTDAEWNAKKWEYIITIATTMASGGIAAGVARGTVGAALTRELAKKGLTAAANAAMQRGAGAYALFVIKELGVKRAAAYGISSLAVESGAFAVSNHAMNRVIYNEPEWNSAEDFMKAWGHSALFLGGCKIGSLGYSFRPVPTSALGKAADAIGGLGAETASMTGTTLAMMALSGEEITAEKFNTMLKENIILTVGLHGAHKLIGAGEAAERDSAMEAERTTKMEQLFQSQFVSDPSRVPAEMRGKAAHINTRGEIIFSPDAFADLGVKATRKGNENVFVVQTREGGPYRGREVEMSPREFLRILAKEKAGTPLTPQEQSLLPVVKEVRDRMAALKSHEAAHRVIETTNNSSGGKVAEALERLFAENPVLKNALEERSGAANRKNAGFESIQEFLSEVAEGRIRMSPEQRALLEKTIAESGKIEGFSFDRIRNIDTQMLADPARLREHFARERAAGSESVDGGKIGDVLIGTKIGDMFVRAVIEGNVMLSHLDPRDPANRGKAEMFKTVPLKEVMNDLGASLKGTQYEGMFINSIMPDGSVYLTHIDMHNPANRGKAVMGRTVPLAEVLAGLRRTAPVSQNRPAQQPKPTPRTPPPLPEAALRTMRQRAVAEAKPAEAARTPGVRITDTTGAQPNRFTESANNLRGVQTKRGFIRDVLSDGTVVLSHLDPTNPANRGQTEMFQNVPFAELAPELTSMLRGKKTQGRYGEMFIDMVMPDGSVHLTTVDPRSPNAMIMAQMGDTVPLADILRQGVGTPQRSAGNLAEYRQGRTIADRVETEGQRQTAAVNKVQALGYQIGAKVGDFYIVDINPASGRFTLSKSTPQEYRRMSEQRMTRSEVNESHTLSVEQIASIASRGSKVTEADVIRMGREYHNSMFESINGPPGAYDFLNADLNTPQPAPNVLRTGSPVEVLNSRGDTVYTDFRITNIDGMTGAVTITGAVNGRVATKVFPSMDALARNMEYAKKVRSLPAEFSLINSNNQVERGWRVESTEPVSGRVKLVNKDGRTFEVPAFEQLNELFSRTEKAKEANARETAELMNQLPQNIDVESNGTVYEDLRIESIDKETGRVTLTTKDGRLRWESMHVRDLVTEVARTKQWRAEQEALRQQALRAPLQAPAQEAGVEWARNEVQQPPEKVQRSSEVVMVGDLHGELTAYNDNLRGLGVIDAAGNWTGGNRKIVFHGDILADRGTNSLPIMENIAKLREQARQAGGDVILLAGNHEDMAISFLTGRDVRSRAGTADAMSMCFLSEQGKGVIEFIKRFSGDPAAQNINNMFEALSVIPMDKAELAQYQRNLLENMRKDPAGRKILEQMANMRLVEQIDDSLFLHTEPTAEILSALESRGNTIGESVDNINRTYQQGLRFLLLGEGTMPKDFDAISLTFLDLENRNFNPRPGQLAPLNRKGINHIVHGHSHSDVGTNMHGTDGVTVMGVDHSYGKGGRTNGKQLSVGRLPTNGKISN